MQNKNKKEGIFEGPFFSGLEKGPETFKRKRGRVHLFNVLGLDKGVEMHPALFFWLNCDNGFFVPHLQCLTPGAKTGGYSSLEVHVV